MISANPVLLTCFFFSLLFFGGFSLSFFFNRWSLECESSSIYLKNPIKVPLQQQQYKNTEGEAKKQPRSPLLPGSALLHYITRYDKLCIHMTHTKVFFSFLLFFFFWLVLPTPQPNLGFVWCPVINFIFQTIACRLQLPVPSIIQRC